MEQVLLGKGGKTSTDEVLPFLFHPPTINCPGAKLTKDQIIRKHTTFQKSLASKYKHLICPHFSWVLLWHCTGTEKMNRKRRAWTCMVITKD